MPEYKGSVLVPKRPENKTAVIIGGRAFSGKSTFGERFQEVMPVKFSVSPMAKDMKQAIHKYYGLTDEEAALVKDKLRGDYQNFGTQAVRHNYKDDFWVITSLRHPSDHLIFDDVRYPIELNTVREYCDNTFAIWLYADEQTRRKRCDAKYGEGAFDRQDHSHSSETAFPEWPEEGWNYYLDNSEHNEDHLLDFADFVAAEICERLALPPIQA